MTSASHVTALCVVAVLGVPQTVMCESSSAARPPSIARDPSSGTRTIEVPAGGDLQAALDEARPGDTVSLAAGAAFVGPFTLPSKRGTRWIVVRGAAADRLPPEG